MVIETYLFTHSWVEMQLGRLWVRLSPIDAAKADRKADREAYENGQAGRRCFPRWAWMEPSSSQHGCLWILRTRYSRLTQWPVKEVLYHSETFGRVLPAVTWLCCVVFQGIMAALCINSSWWQHRPEVIVGGGYFYTDGDEDVDLAW